MLFQNQCFFCLFRLCVSWCMRMACRAPMQWAFSTSSARCSPDWVCHQHRIQRKFGMSCCAQPTMTLTKKWPVGFPGIPVFFLFPCHSISPHFITISSHWIIGWSILFSPLWFYKMVYPLHFLVIWKSNMAWRVYTGHVVGSIYRNDNVDLQWPSVLPHVFTIKWGALLFSSSFRRLKMATPVYTC